MMETVTFYCGCRRKGWKALKAMFRHMEEHHPCRFWDLV